MAISYVGGVQGGRAGATTTTTQSLSGTLTGGTNTSPSAGDLVVVLCAAGADTTAAPSQNISGNNNGAYTGLTAQSQLGGTYDSYHRVSYIIQGSTVDTTITIPSSGSARNAQRWVVHVFRDVDSGTPMDATATYATGTATGRPNPAAITPVTSGAWIMAFYASAAGTGAAYTAPTDFATDWLGGTTADTADCMTGAGYYTGWTSGSYDPAAITAGGTTGAADAWTATTVALRPAVAPTLTTDASPSSVTSSSAVYDTNNISSTGGSTVTTRGICWVSGAGGTPTTADSKTTESGSFGTGDFSATATGLSASTTYSVRAYATNAIGTSYGATVEVTTSAASANNNQGLMLMGVG